MEAICRAGLIVDVEAFWITLRANRPISLATTYNTFRLMTQYGLLERKKEGSRFVYYRQTSPVNQEIKESTNTFIKN